jgi:hypothetical protein
MLATRKRPGVNEPGNRQERRDPMDSTREVPIGATIMIRTACKETLQSLVTTFVTNMELEIKVIDSPEQQTCYRCGKKGHYAKKCPGVDSNDASSTRSSLSNRSNNNSRHNRVGWSS